MVYDKDLKVYSCDICYKQFTSWWKMQWHYFVHGWKGDKLLSISNR